MNSTVRGDQTGSSLFRSLSVVQLLVAGLPFGLLPLVVPQTAAALAGYTRTEASIYRSAGGAKLKSRPLFRARRSMS